MIATGKGLNEFNLKTFSLVRNLQLERGYTSLSLYSENNEERVITFDIVDNAQFAIVIFVFLINIKNNILIWNVKIRK